MKPVLLLAFAAATWAAAGCSNEDNITAVVIDWGDGNTSKGFIPHPCVYCRLYGASHICAATGACTSTVTCHTGCCVSDTTKVRANVRESGRSDCHLSTTSGPPIAFLPLACSGACTVDVLRAVELQFLDGSMPMPTNGTLASIATPTFSGVNTTRFRVNVRVHT